ncbi:MAG: AAA family ATPase [Candidatus Magasanikbacteria bacterium]|nr:AAA family ATPase [Candidatus Magasanikbacteria bacterium]
MNSSVPSSKTSIEIERRFLVKRIKTNKPLSGCTKDHISQGYFGSLPGKTMRVRIKNNSTTIFTVKRGSGISRDEIETTVINENIGKAALDACVFTLSKTRYTFDGWELDIFEGPLKGLVLLERELLSEDEELPPFPDFLEMDQEVTNSINNLALAEASAMLTENVDPNQLLTLMSVTPLPMVVLTGGPCSGKSTSMQELRERYPELAFVPEVATIVIAQVGIRPPVGDAVGSAKFQKLIYAVQRAFEHAAQDQAIRDGKKAIILDRGSMDNAAYIDGGVETLTSLLRTTREAEYARYQAVICLSQPSQEVYERMRSNNPARSEDYETAEALSERIKNAWRQHPCCYMVPKGDQWQEVSMSVHETLSKLVKGL